MVKKNNNYLYKKDFKGVCFVEYNNSIVAKRVDNEVFIEPENVSKKFLVDFSLFLKDIFLVYNAVKIQDKYKHSRKAFVLSNGVVIHFSCDTFTYLFIMSYIHDLPNKDLFMGNIIKEYLDSDTSEDIILDRLAELEDVYKT